MTPSRRRLLKGAAAFAALPGGALAQAPVPIADMHSHYGMIQRRIQMSGFADELRAQRVALVAWKIVADNRWIRSTPTGIEQFREPAPGELARFFHDYLDTVRAYVADHKLRAVLTRADIDACLGGEAGVVIASEGADFLEGRVENLDAAYDKGLRHLQLVHYIRTPIGDFQTARPTHNGLTEVGKRLVEACNAKGVLVDLAHSTPESVDQALEIAKVPLVWSHGWVHPQAGDWRNQYGYLGRRLSLDQAKKIAGRGGVIGLWGLGLSKPANGWSVTPRNTDAYADELAALVGKLGADHVALGTDIEGVGPNWSVNSYADVRKVIERLQQLKLGDSVIERVAFGNYARVLRSVLT